ncbi:carboxypeptidase-like regulatory domain-containing protein [Microlunatus sp. Y2014]|uniref:carboxypeptidase-like regulatory domain-containing protein n=1 Tax=Microlunatus sp. Y2014 TaxID=3418488 RepID=UPI003DA72A35
MRGRRADGSTGPLANAEVLVIGGTTRLTTTTAADGEWLAFVPPGEWQVEVNAVGHDPVTRTVTVAADPVRLDLALTAVAGARVSHRRVPGARSEAKATDLVLENDRLALAVAVTTQDGQLNPVTPGKVLDGATVGQLDQLDWINLPWISTTLPAGPEAWQIRTVRADRVDAVESGPERAVVEATGVCTTVPGLAVTTRYTLEPGADHVQLDTTLALTGDAPVTLWLGDALDHDGAGQRSVVAGHGVITTPYAEQHSYVPAGDWMAMTGTDRQVYAVHYEGDFEAYGNGNWIQSRQQVTVTPGSPTVLRRRLVITGDGRPYGLA